jgi:putative transcriptional regulator
MTRLLGKKGLSTKFQILLEIAANQPYVQQKTIANNINLTSQAISLYVREMVEDGWVKSDRKSGCHITMRGVDWLIKILREMQAYTSRAEKISQSISVYAAMAVCDTKKGQTVSLEMVNGILVAGKNNVRSAKGVAVSSAMQGEDIGVSCIKGTISVNPKRVKILTIPRIQKGGSRKVDLERLRNEVESGSILCATGLEAIVALNQAGMTPQYTHGVKEVAVEAAQRGLEVKVACVSSGIHLLMQTFDENNIEYDIINMENKSD